MRPRSGLMRGRVTATVGEVSSCGGARISCVAALMAGPPRADPRVACGAIVAATAGCPASRPHGTF